MVHTFTIAWFSWYYKLQSACSFWQFVWLLYTLYNLFAISLCYFIGFLLWDFCSQCCIILSYSWTHLFLSGLSIGLGRWNLCILFSECAAKLHLTLLCNHCLIFKNSGLQQAGDLLLAHRLGNSLFGMDNLLILKWFFRYITWIIVSILLL